MKNVPVRRDVPDGPLAEPGAGQSEDVAAGLVDMSVESGFHLKREIMKSSPVSW